MMPGQIRNILLAVEIRPAGKLSKCSHDRRHVITKGEPRVVIKNAAAVGEKGYCTTCATAIIALAKQRITELEHQLVA